MPPLPVKALWPGHRRSTSGPLQGGEVSRPALCLAASSGLVLFGIPTHTCFGFTCTVLRQEGPFFVFWQGTRTRAGRNGGTKLLLREGPTKADCRAAGGGGVAISGPACHRHCGEWRLLSRVAVKGAQTQGGTPAQWGKRHPWQRVRTLTTQSSGRRSGSRSHVRGLMGSSPQSLCHL